MMRINNINLNCLKIFETVYRTGSMTKAAEELFLTQSGVSQHIKSLEDGLGIKLFERVNKQLQPTRKGQKLYNKTLISLQGLEGVINEVCETELAMEGTVRIGMPIQFGVDRLLPKIAILSNRYPNVNFNIEMGVATQIRDMLLKGELHFAFTDNFIESPKIQSQKVFEETLELCVSSEYYNLNKIASLNASSAALKKLDFIAYEVGCPVLRSWFNHHLSNRKMAVNVRGRVMDTQGVSQLIINHMGAGILPDHFVERLRKQGHKLHTFKSNHKPLINSISIVSLRSRAKDYVFDLIAEKMLSHAIRNN